MEEKLKHPSYKVGKDLLFPELGEDAAAEFHSLQRLLGYLHLAVNDVQSALYLLQLLWAQSTQSGNGRFLAYIPS